MRFSKIDAVQADLLDFVPRERRGQVRRVIVRFILAALAILAIAYVPALSGLALYTPVIAVLLIALLALYVAYHHQVALDQLLATEYQNMLFSQALGLGSAFSMIVRRDGSIVHASDGFGAIFPKFDYASSQALEGVFEQGTVRKLDRERIMGAIHTGSTERLVFPVVTQYTDKKDYIITVEPLARPAGFCLVRGREYLGQRTGLQMLPDSLRTTSVDKIDHLLASTSVGHYTTDQYGRFEYVNPAFEQLLGYAPHEIIESKLSLHHVFYSFGLQTLTEEYAIGDYGGNASAVSKEHGRQSVMVSQSAIRDSNGKAVGATGSVSAAG